MTHALAALSAALIAWRLRLLTAGGAASAFVVGFVAVYAGGWGAAAPLLAFFVGSAALGRLRGRERETRGPGQVWANGLAATLCATGSLLGVGEWVWAGYAAAWAQAAADTWATEVGIGWGGRPRSILTGRALEAGESGGITLLGTVAAFAGALFVSGIGSVALGLPWIVPAIAGFAGSLLDSLLGATLQVRFRCAVCGRIVETPLHCSKASQRISGAALLTNSGVNVASNLAATLAACLIAFRN